MNSVQLIELLDCLDDAEDLPILLAGMVVARESDALVGERDHPSGDLDMVMARSLTALGVRSPTDQVPPPTPAPTPCCQRAWSCSQQTVAASTSHRCRVRRGRRRARRDYPEGAWLCYPVEGLRLLQGTASRATPSAASRARSSRRSHHIGCPAPRNRSTRPESAPRPTKGSRCRARRLPTRRAPRVSWLEGRLGTGRARFCGRHHGGSRSRDWVESIFALRRGAPRSASDICDPPG